MHVIITELSTTKVGIWSKITIRSFELSLCNRKMLFSTDPKRLALFLSSECDFTVTAKVKGREISKEVCLQEGSISLVFDFQDIEIAVKITMTANPWLDSEMTDTIGTYKDREYFVDPESLETSFSPLPSFQRRFPSFTTVEYKGKKLYIDNISKMVISVNPIVRETAILMKVSEIIKKHKEWAAPPRNIQVDRRQLLKSSWKRLLSTLNHCHILNVRISFIGEIGEDQGAIRREFLYLLFKELLESNRIETIDQITDVNPNFDCSDFIYVCDTRRDEIEAMEDILNDETLTTRAYFVLLGVIMASLFILSERFPVNFSLIFYENLLGRCFTTRHIQDTELQKNLTLFSNSLCSVVDSDSPCDLPDTSGDESNQSNRYIHERLFEPRKNHYDYIRFGFHFILNTVNPSKITSKNEITSKLSAFDFPFIFYHFEPITVERLKGITAYINCNVDTPEITWLWDCLEHKDQHFLSRLLQFTIGSGNLPSILSSERIFIERVANKGSLFRASACVNRLYLPQFETREDLRRSLERSVLDSEGFHFV